MRARRRLVTGGIARSLPELPELPELPDADVSEPRFEDRASIFVFSSRLDWHYCRKFALVWTLMSPIRDLLVKRHYWWRVL